MIKNLILTAGIALLASPLGAETARTWLVVLPSDATGEPEVVTIDPSSLATQYRTASGEEIEIAKDGEGYRMNVNGKTFRFFAKEMTSVTSGDAPSNAFFFRVPAPNEMTPHAMNRSVHVQALTIKDGPELVLIQRREPSAHQPLGVRPQRPIQEKPEKK